MNNVKYLAVAILLALLLTGFGVFLWSYYNADNYICQNGTCTLYMVEGEMNCHVTRDVFGKILSSGCP